MAAPRKPPLGTGTLASLGSAASPAPKAKSKANNLGQYLHPSKKKAC